jgi:hypothetical protein
LQALHDFREALLPCPVGGGGGKLGDVDVDVG